jgi:phenylalanyl-tRNA synthetase alpha chain
MITGSLHPLTAATRELLDVFYGMGFTVFESREAETDDINFVKLNLAPGHPARDMQDSLYLSESVVMRTHTSPGQIRGMWEMKGELPVRFVVPGRVYRRDLQMLLTNRFFIR